MKKLLFLCVMLGSLAAHAGNYPYLTFELTDGSKCSVAAESLSLTISGSTLTAGTQTFVLTNLSKMYFSTADETTGIEAISAQNLSEASEIYDLSGRKVQKDQMRSGQVYIVKTKKGSHKLTVR